MKKKDRILRLWKQTIVVHPSYGSIAKKIGCNKSYVFKVVKKYKEKTND